MYQSVVHTSSWIKAFKKYKNFYNQNLVFQSMSATFQIKLGVNFFLLQNTRNPFCKMSFSYPLPPWKNLRSLESKFSDMWVQSNPTEEIGLSIIKIDLFSGFIFFSIFCHKYLLQFQPFICQTLFGNTFFLINILSSSYLW